MTDTHSKKNATTIGGLMVVGLGAGLAIGTAVDNIPVYMSAGMAVGILVGVLLDAMNRRNQGG